MRTIREVTHALAAIAGWLFFGLLWWWAFSRGAPSSAVIASFVTLVVYSLLVVAVDWVWVRHAVWVSSFRRQRTSVPVVHREYTHDVTGRPISADWEAVRAACYVVIDIVDRDGTPTKTYAAGGVPLSAEEVMGCELP